MKLSLGEGGSAGRLVAVLDVGGRTAQCSIVDAGIEVSKNMDGSQLPNPYHTLNSILILSPSNRWP